MHLSYLFLSRFATEINDTISGMTITGLHTQEKNKLVMTLERDSENKYLEFSCDPFLIYMNLRQSFHKAGQNYTDFITESLPSQILSVKIAVGDRVIKFECREIDIYFLIRGRFSNLFFSDKSNVLDTFKNLKDDNRTKIFNELKSSFYVTNGIESITPPSIDYAEPDEVKKQYPFFSKDIYQLSPYQLNPGNIISAKSISSAIHDFASMQFSLVDDKDGKHRIVPDNWAADKNPILTGQSAINIVDELIRSSFYKSYQRDLKEKVATYLERELIKIDKSVIQISQRQSEGNRAEVYRAAGTLLLNNFSMLKKGMDHFTGADQSGNTVEIKLKNQYSPKQNVDYYFEKARDEESSFEKYSELLTNYGIKKAKIAELLDQVNSLTDQKELEKIAHKLKIKMDQGSKPKSESPGKFREYIIDDHYHLFVGKDSINNDLLTLHFAKKEDLWFHARSVPGSHVVLRVNGDYKEIPKSVIKTAAAVAAWYSKAKTAGLSPVAFTQKKYVVKKKGMEPGKVMLMKEQVILVRPEIPSNCKIVNDSII